MVLLKLFYVFFKIGLFAFGGKFFEEVYSIRPVLKMKKTI